MLGHLCNRLSLFREKKRAATTALGTTGSWRPSRPPRKTCLRSRWALEWLWMGRTGLVRKIGLTVLAVTAIVALTSAMTFSAFSATTTTGANSFQAGTVVLSGTGTAQTLFSGSAMKPGDQQQACLTVDYTGSLTATIRLYASVTGTLDQYLTTTIERGSLPSSPPANGSCSGFVKDTTNGDLFSGKLNGLPSNWATGIADPRSIWNARDSATYRITITQDDVSAAQGQTGSAAFTVEAQAT